MCTSQRISRGRWCKGVCHEKYFTWRMTRMYLSQRKSYPVADDVRVRYKVLREIWKIKKSFLVFLSFPRCFYIFFTIIVFIFLLEYLPLIFDGALNALNEYFDSCWCCVCIYTTICFHSISTHCYTRELLFNRAC